MLPLKNIFDTLPRTYPGLKAKAYGLAGRELYATSNFYHIELYYYQLMNKFPGESARFITHEKEFNPENETLYVYGIRMEDRQIFYKKEIRGKETYYEDIFEYDKELHQYKVYSVYVSGNECKAIEVGILFFEMRGKGLYPSHYTYCNKYAAGTKKYTYKEDYINGFDHHQITNHGADEVFEERVDVCFHDRDKGEVEKILRHNTYGTRTLYQRADPNIGIEPLMAEVTEQLADSIRSQIMEKVRIEEKVCCILLEYTMQGPLPPTMAIGLESERTAWIADGYDPDTFYNAPDMQYFSEEEKLGIELYTPVLESNYLLFNNYCREHKVDAPETAFALYLGICKALNVFDFSRCFVVTEDFLVLARDFETCNEGEFLSRLRPSRD